LSLSKTLKGLAAALFVLALPVLFGTTSLRWLVSDSGWYRSGFVKYGVSARTGIAPEELGRKADEISSYLLLQRERVDDIQVVQRGQTGLLFGDRENKHMADVRDLMGRFFALQVASGVYVLAYLAGGRLWLGRGYWPAIGRGLRLGGTITLGLFGLVGALSLVDFDRLFLQFHLVSFDNDLWILDPTRDNLIMMFPQGFWYDSAIRLALATGSQALLAIVVGWVLSRKQQVYSHQSSVISRF
jgi:integral membrane protein (TIGR01906 family)